MNGFALTTDTVLLLLPLIAIQAGLAIYCAIKIFREGVENLSKWAWLVICLFVNLLGPVVFLIVGRKKEYR
ncbi:MAG: PLD nuclease N-terminal domain-containing protein [Anaerovoracaceae bacterium]